MTLEGSCNLWRGIHGATDCEPDWSGVAVYPMFESAQLAEVDGSIDDSPDHARMTFCRGTTLHLLDRDWVEDEVPQLPIQICPRDSD